MLLWRETFEVGRFPTRVVVRLDLDDGGFCDGFGLDRVVGLGSVVAGLRRLLAVGVGVFLVVDALFRGTTRRSAGAVQDLGVLGDLCFLDEVARLGAIATLPLAAPLGRGRLGGVVPGGLAGLAQGTLGRFLGVRLVSRVGLGGGRCRRRACACVAWMGGTFVNDACCTRRGKRNGPAEEARRRAQVTHPGKQRGLDCAMPTSGGCSAPQAKLCRHAWLGCERGKTRKRCRDGQARAMARAGAGVVGAGQAARRVASWAEQDATAVVFANTSSEGKQCKEDWRDSGQKRGGADARGRERQRERERKTKKR